MDELSDLVRKIVNIVITKETMEHPVILVHKTEELNINNEDLKLDKNRSGYQIFPDLLKINEEDIDIFIDEFILAFNIKNVMEDYKKELINNYVKSSIFIKFKDLQKYQMLIGTNRYCPYNFTEKILEEIRTLIVDFFTYDMSYLISSYLSENSKNTIETYKHSKNFYGYIWYKFNSISCTYIEDTNSAINYYAISRSEKSDIIGYITNLGGILKIYNEDNEEIEYIDNFYYYLYFGQYKKQKGIILPSVII